MQRADGGANGCKGVGVCGCVGVRARGAVFTHTPTPSHPHTLTPSPYSGNLPFNAVASNGPFSASNRLAASTWFQVFHSSTPRTRPPSR